MGQHTLCEPQFIRILVMFLVTSDTHFQDCHRHFYGMSFLVYFWQTKRDGCKCNCIYIYIYLQLFAKILSPWYMYISVYIYIYRVHCGKVTLENLLPARVIYSWNIFNILSRNIFLWLNVDDFFVPRNVF